MNQTQHHREFLDDFTEKVLKTYEKEKEDVDTAAGLMVKLLHVTSPGSLFAIAVIGRMIQMMGEEGDNVMYEAHKAKESNLASHAIIMATMGIATRGRADMRFASIVGAHGNKD